MDLKKPKIAHFYDVKYSKNYGVFLKIFDVRIFVRILAKICGHLCTFWPKYVRFLKKFWCAHFCAPFGQLMCAFEFRIIRHSGQHSTEIKHDELNQVARLVNQCQSKIKEFSVKFKTFVIHSFTFKSKNCRIQEEGETAIY